MSIRSGRNAPLALGVDPRVNLLPPEVVQRGKERETRKVLGLIVVASVILVGTASAVAYSHAAVSQGDLIAAQATTQKILTEQLEYSEATTTIGLIASAKSAREVGASTEILWGDLVGTIKTYLPEGVTIESASMLGRAPWEVEMLPTGPLRQPRVATLNLVLASGSRTDLSDTIRQLAALPGFADATPDLVTADGERFVTTITLNLNAAALSGRFADNAKEETE